MKKLVFVLSVLFHLSITMSGQPHVDINPSESTEFCPFTNTTFTVSIAGTFTEVTLRPSTNSPIIIYNPTTPVYNSNTNSTTFSFVASFQDMNVVQEYILSYGNYNHTFSFNRSNQYV